MSGQSLLFRTAMTCAAIVIGSAIVGSQLSSTGDLSRVASGVSDEEEEERYAEPGDEPGQAGVETDDEAGVTGQDEEFAEDVDDDDGDFAEDDSSEISEDESGADSEGEDEDEGGIAIVRRKP